MNTLHVGWVAYIIMVWLVLMNEPISPLLALLLMIASNISITVRAKEVGL